MIEISWSWSLVLLGAALLVLALARSLAGSRKKTEELMGSEVPHQETIKKAA